jgi:ABC-type polar amino acid transport system ATPase subunit
MEKKQTAVEWFWNNLTDDMIGDLSPEQIGSIYKLMEQARQMEKEQIEEAHDVIIIQAVEDGVNFWEQITGEQYYNETYGGNNDN